MSLEKFIDERIKKAIAEGGFIDLPGSGRPIDLRAYFETPEDLRMCFSILKQGNFVPEEVELLKEIEGLRNERAACPEEGRRAELNKAINEKVLLFRTLMERRPGAR
ncbi:MAG TPA: DUF1992 domain-containing protein [Pyrinomonadaceae bacterium]